MSIIAEPEPADGADGVELRITGGNRQGMTFRELRQFVQRAMSNDAADEAQVKARVSFGGKLQAVEVKVDPGTKVGTP